MSPTMFGTAEVTELRPSARMTSPRCARSWIFSGRDGPTIRATKTDDPAA
jgi:hypothetical protein